MDPQLSKVLLLAVPSLVGFLLLCVHGFAYRPAKTMVAFLVGSLGFGLIRAHVIHWLTIDAPTAFGGGDFFGFMPYLMTTPLARVGNASLQECMGWSFALYLGWSLSERILARWNGSQEPPLFSVVFLVSIFMASIAYAVEAGAGALSWWVWTIPVTSRHLLEVPAAGIWAWFSVAVDFFLPFLVLVNRRAFPGWVRVGVLLIFPIHMAAHLLDVVGGHWGFSPILAPSAVAHWTMLFGVLALALICGSRPWKRRSVAGLRRPVWLGVSRLRWLSCC